MQTNRAMDPHFPSGSRIVASPLMATDAPKIGILYVPDSKAEREKLAGDWNGCLHHFRQAKGKDCRICGRKDLKNNGRPRRFAGLSSSRAKMTPRFAKRLLNQT